MPPIAAVIHDIARGMAAEAAPESDPELVRRFLDTRDAGAFEALVRRHGPMVSRVCRRVAGHEQDAEDAFQATFLVLARTLQSVRNRASLASWLHGTARRTALKAKARAAARRRHELAVPRAGTVPVEDAAWGETRAVLDEELARLPERWRLPLVLCYLEGRTQDEAAAQLAWPKNTFRRRLDEARAALANRLARRGVLPAALAAVLLSECAAPAALAPRLVALVLETAAAAPAVPARVAALARQATLTATLKKLALAGAAVLVAAVLGWSATGRAMPTRATSLPSPEEKPDAKAKPGWEEAFAIKHEHPLTAIVCSADLLAAGDEGGNLYLCDPATGKNRRHKLVGGKGGKPIDCAQFTADGKHLFLVRESRAGFWMTHPRDNDQKAWGTGGSGSKFLDISADGRAWLELNGRSLLVRPNLYLLEDTPENFETDYESAIRYEAGIVHAVMSPPDGKLLAIVTADEKIHVHKREARKDQRLDAAAQTIVLAKHKVNALQFSKDGARLAVVGDDGFAKVYDPATGKEVAMLKGHGGLLFCVAFGPDGKTVVTGGDDNIVRVWNAETGGLLASLEGHTDSVRCAAFDPKGELLFTGSPDKTLKAWRPTR
jgi:RNA polymerase sigma factor (sigma-70 family)